MKPVLTLPLSTVWGLTLSLSNVWGYKLPLSTVWGLTRPHIPLVQCERVTLYKQQCDSFRSNSVDKLSTFSRYMWPVYLILFNSNSNGNTDWCWQSVFTHPVARRPDCPAPLIFGHWPLARLVNWSTGWSIGHWRSGAIILVFGWRLSDLVFQGLYLGCQGGRGAGKNTKYADNVRN